MFQKIINFILRFLRALFNIESETSTKSTESTESQKQYVKKSIMTDCEYTFYKKMQPLEDSHNIKIIPQLNLASIIKKISNEKYQNELYRNIDFAIFNNDLTDVLLLIELNDSTHNAKSRQYRDAKVKSLTKSVGIELMTFYTNYENKSDYVQNRIIKALTKSNDSESKEETKA